SAGWVVVPGRAVSVGSSDTFLITKSGRVSLDFGMIRSTRGPLAGNDAKKTRGQDRIPRSGLDLLCYRGLAQPLRECLLPVDDVRRFSGLLNGHTPIVGSHTDGSISMIVGLADVP